MAFNGNHVPRTRAERGLSPEPGLVEESFPHVIP